MSSGGIVKPGDDIFSSKPKAKGLNFQKGGLDCAPGNYMEHNRSGRTFYQVIGEDHWWDSKDKNIKIDPVTLATIVTTALKAPLLSRTPTIPLPDSPERIARRTELEATNYPSIRRTLPEIKMTKGLTKEKLIEMVLTNEGL